MFGFCRLAVFKDDGFRSETRHVPQHAMLRAFVLPGLNSIYDVGTIIFLAGGAAKLMQKLAPFLSDQRLYIFAITMSCCLKGQLPLAYASRFGPRLHQR
jgi:hypothetical protein